VLEGGETPAVALTAYVRDEDAGTALAAGYHRHIRKPVVVEDLIAAVAALAGGRREVEAASLKLEADSPKV
jgi:CheY-like chemotaxis protein